MRTRRFELLAKRVIDLVVASVGLLALAPVMGATALAILLTLGRPVLFKQQRPGYLGRPFTICKFRTMHMTDDAKEYFRTDAERLTNLGRFLRRTSLDELPELWNVLRGEMSLVGPRPLLVEYLPRYTDEQRRRHDVRPGITGWAAVHGRQEIPLSQRFALDVWYVDHWTLGLDLRILTMTLRDVVHRRGIVPGQSVEEVDDLGFLQNVPPADLGAAPPHGADKHA